MTRRVGKRRVLLERDLEVSQLGVAIRQAGSGAGGAIVIEGPPGIGKSELVNEALARARGGGFEILVAKGGQLETNLALGVVRQLFEARVLRANECERTWLLSGPARLALQALELDAPAGDDAPGHPGDEFSLFHALYWLCANLAQRHPMLIAIDDAHWADPPSLRWCLYLLRRLEDMPVLLVLALRGAEPSDEGQVLEQIRSHDEAVRLHPSPLSEGAVGELVRLAYGRQPDGAFCKACHEATGGNPFLVRELLAALRSEQIGTTADGAARVQELGPASIARSVLLRLGQLPGSAVKLARAAAVLGTSGELRHAARLAGLDDASAASALDILSTAGILKARAPLEFVHPVVRSAIHADLSFGSRALAHRDAARLLSDEGAEPEKVATHLLCCEPAADPWAVTTLQEAARAALARHSRELAIRYLRRALAEPPLGELRAEVLLDLGVAEARSGEPEAKAHLVEATSLISDPRRRAEAARELALLLRGSGQFSEAVDLFGQAINDLRGVEPARSLQIEVELLASARWEPSTRWLVDERAPRLKASSAGKDRAERDLVAFLAQEAVFANESAPLVVELATQALDGGRMLTEETAEAPLYYYAVDALTFAGRYEPAAHALDQALRDAAARGSLRAFCAASMSRALLFLHRGCIPDAEEDARRGLDAAVEVSMDVAMPVFAALLVDAVLERGDLDAARGVLVETGLDGDVGACAGAFLALASRGRLHNAQGRRQEGLADLLDAGSRQESLRIISPSVSAWRSSAALALAGEGRTEEALCLAEEELSLAQDFAAPRPIGVALHSLGLVRGGVKGLELLGEAVDVLETSGATLEYARTLTDLGAALRRHYRRADARDPLGRALDLAHACGASALADRAHEELLATGARPRRVRSSGVGALTASERRVASMALDGLSNREIAQSLFISQKTVESHLGHAYRKLGIASREELPQAVKTRA